MNECWNGCKLASSIADEVRIFVFAVLLLFVFLGQLHLQFLQVLVPFVVCSWCSININKSSFEGFGI